MKKTEWILAGAALLTGLGLGYLFFGKIPQTAGMEMAPAVRCADGEELRYTCAMHPDIQQPEPGKCPLCTMPLTTDVFNRSGGNDLIQLHGQEARLAGIETCLVEVRRRVPLTVELSGRLAPDESRVFHQIAHLPGIIEELYVDQVGASVRKGQPIASVYSKELIAVVEAFEYSRNSESVLRSARNNLAVWKVRPDQLKKLDLKGDYRRPVDVFSDFSGVITRLHVRGGDYAVNTHMGAPTIFYEIADLTRLWALLEAPPSDLASLRIGDAVMLEVPAFPDLQLTGRVEQIDPEVDPVTGTARIRVGVSNPGGRLRPEMLVYGDIRVERTWRRPQVVIPKSAVLWTGRRSVVYVRDTSFLDTNPIYAFRKVVLGGDLGDHYWIESGLREGEEVVVNGAFRLDATAQLRNKSNMLDPRPEIKERGLAEYGTELAGTKKETEVK